MKDPYLCISSKDVRVFLEQGRPTRSLEMVNYSVFLPQEGSSLFHLLSFRTWSTCFEWEHLGVKCLDVLIVLRNETRRNRGYEGRELSKGGRSQDPWALFAWINDLSALRL